MKPLTVKELLVVLEDAVNKGYGDYVVQVSDDEECNGYHELWYTCFEKGGKFVCNDNGKRKSFDTILIA